MTALNTTSSSVKPICFYDNKELTSLVGGFLVPAAANAQYLEQLKDQLDQVPAMKPPERVFWDLGKRFWMQIIDGKFHSFGQWVFDKGLHGRDVEPGFFDSLKAVCLWIGTRTNIVKKLTSTYYKMVHSIACRHFDGDANCTLIKSDRVGKFQASLGKGCNAEGAALFPLEFSTAKDLARFEEQRKIHEDNINNGYSLLYRLKIKVDDQFTQIKDYIQTHPESTEVAILENFLKSSEWKKAWEEKIAVKLEKINAEIAEKSKELGLSHPIAVLHGGLKKIYLTYCCSQEEYEKVVDAIFTRYHAKIAKAQTEADKNRCIAELFQLLEWVHPFADGQGRTDLLILAKELSCHLTPAILNEPYVSSFSTLDDWAEHLTRGRKKWREEASEAGKLDYAMEELAEKMRVVEIPSSNKFHVYGRDAEEHRIEIDPDTGKLKLHVDRLSMEDLKNGYIDLYVQTRLDKYQKHENEGWRNERLYILTKLPPRLRLKLPAIFARAKQLKAARASSSA